MKIFIITTTTYYDGSDVECVFSSLESAWKFMDDYAIEFNKKANPKYPLVKSEDGYASSLEEITVSEFEVQN